MAAGPAPGAGQDPPPRGEPSRPTSGHPTVGQSGSGHSGPLAAPGDADAWWEGDWLPDDDDLEESEWADPPGQPLDEHAIQAARAASISAEVLGTGFWRRVGAGPGARTITLARDITARAAAHPSTSWSLTITRTGHAIAHGPPRGPHDGGPDDSGPSHLPPGQPRPPGRPPNPGDLTVKITPLARDGCDHRTEEFRYQPGQRLQNLIRARTTTCSAPGCRRSAARCDLDHTIPHDHGGRSCECNLAPPRL